MGLRGWLVDYSKGDNLDGFWRVFRLRERTKVKLFADILTFFINRMAHRHGGYIGRGAVFGGEPVLPHGLHGVFVSRCATVGRDCRIYHNVTIGEIGGRAPQIGDSCLIGAGAVLVGGIKIGNNVKIGAGAVVSRDIPDNCTVVSGPPRIIQRGQKNEQDESSMD